MDRKHFFQKMSPAIVAVGVLFTAAAASIEQTAAIDKPVVLAQGGSTGGTIGKQEKSSSGGEVRVPTRAHRAPLPRKPHVVARERQAKHHVAAREWQAPLPRKHHVSEVPGSHCGKIVGTWLPGGGQLTFDQNGGARFTLLLSATGQWTCANGKVIVAWNNGDVTRATLSHDGNSLTGATNNGKTWVATRK
jgi:hypothetical protein